MTKDPLEDKRLKAIVETLNSVRVNTAAWAFRESYNSYYSVASTLPLEEIDAWVISLQSHRVEEIWDFQKEMTKPHLFFYAMLKHYRFRALKELALRRGSLGGTPLGQGDDFDRYPQIAARISEIVLGLPIYEGVAFLGELTGTWMLTCPESVVRGQRNIERVGRWQTGKETAEWDVPLSWFEFIGPEDVLRKKFADAELRLLFTLDFFLYLAFEDYEVANTRKQSGR